jgi:hypothetical protein
VVDHFDRDAARGGPVEGAVRLILVVTVKLGLIHPLGDAVKVREKVDLFVIGPAVRLGTAEEIVNKNFWLHLFLNVEGRRVNYQVGPVLFVLSPPNKAVGMFFRLSSEWEMVATVFPAGGF